MQKIVLHKNATARPYGRRRNMLLNFFWLLDWLDLILPLDSHSESLANAAVASSTKKQMIYFYQMVQISLRLLLASSQKAPLDIDRVGKLGRSSTQAESDERLA